MDSGTISRRWPEPAVCRIRHVDGVVAVRDRLGYPDVYPIVAGPVFWPGR
jgi:hypothetical protein